MEKRSLIFHFTQFADANFISAREVQKMNIFLNRRHRRNYALAFELKKGVCARASAQKRISQRQFLVLVQNEYLISLRDAKIKRSTLSVRQEKGNFSLILCRRALRLSCFSAAAAGLVAKIFIARDAK